MVRMLDREDVRRLVGLPDAVAVVREALAAAHRGEAVAPAPLALRLPDADGELHVKGAYLSGDPVFAVKTATGFYRNPSRGLPVSGGMTMVYDAWDGRLRALIADGGLLTDLRTGAAGAVAADLLARPGAWSAAMIGTGEQARHQLRALLAVRPLREVRVWGRRQEAARHYAHEMAAEKPGIEGQGIEGLKISVAATAREAVEGAAIVVTATSAVQPLLWAGWLAAGTHVTAVGADMPHKQELDPLILAAADKYVPDSVQAAAACGELHHAVEAGLLDLGAVYGELGALAAGLLPGRTGEDELTVADLTGLGVQDAAVAALVTRLAEDQDAGRDLPLP